MRKILLIFSIIILFLAAVTIYNNDTKVIVSRLNKNSNIQIGDLRYRINLLGVIPVGEAIFQRETIEEYKGQRVYHLIAAARNLSIFSKFFSSYAALDSYIDMQQFNPILFKQRLLVTGKEGIDKEVIYDQRQGIMSIANVRRQILPNTQDPLSAIFNIRRMDFDKTKEFEMNLNTNQKNYILKGTARLKNILVNKKIYKIILLGIQISRRDKNPYHKSRIKMVLLKEKDNLPILIDVFASGIFINAYLIDIK